MYKKILSVEDEQFLLGMYSEILREAGHEVDTASDGKEALIKIRKNHYDLILLDIVLPKIDGLKLLEIMAKENIKQGKIVILSNLGHDVVRKEANRQKVDDYWLKSDYTPDGLVKKVNQL